MVLGLTAVAAFAGKGKFLKAAIMTIFGLMLATVGTDSDSGIARFTFGRLDLIDGISFLLLAMAAFALSEAMMNILENEKQTKEEIDELKKRYWFFKNHKRRSKGDGSNAWEIFCFRFFLLVYYQVQALLLLHF